LLGLHNLILFNRHCEERSDVATQCLVLVLRRYAPRNDGKM